MKKQVAAPINTVNTTNLVVFSNSVYREIDSKLDRNLCPVPWNSQRFSQSVSWIRDCYREVNNIANVDDFSECCDKNGKLYIWTCDNIGTFYLQLFITNSIRIVTIVDCKLSSLVPPYTLVDHKVSDEDYCKILIELADEHWHNLFR